MGKFSESRASIQQRVYFGNKAEGKFVSFRLELICWSRGKLKLNEQKGKWK